MGGLRLDATQSIHDPDHPTLLASISRERVQPLIRAFPSSSAPQALNSPPRTIY
jgi:hypothetical protein